MRMEGLIAALILLGDLSGSAQADIGSAPRFSSAETQTIARNELLNAVIAEDPWLVRRILDAMSRGIPSADRQMAARREGLDAHRDPDLTISPRDIQGVVEWHELIKRARAEKDARGKPSAPNLGRSSEGSVELIDMMRRAKARKDAAGGP